MPMSQLVADPTCPTPTCPAPRHATFLLQYLHTHLSEAGLQQVTDLLQGAANEREAGQEDRMLPFIGMTTQDKPIALSKIPTVQ